MPIKPANMPQYPGGSINSKEWKAIRAEILDAQEHRCKECGVADKATIYRVNEKRPDGTRVFIDPENGEVFDADTGKELGVCRISEWPEGRYTRIVLTVAHLDCNPRNNGVPGDRPNLAALCQMHHFAHDREHHQRVRAETIREKRDRERVSEFGPMLPMFG